MSAKKSRSENWPQEDKELFFNIMEKSAKIIECKKTDTNTNTIKSREWLNIQNKFTELTGKRRDVAQLKGFWRRAKRAKEHVLQHKKQLKYTGGGPRPPTPSESDQRILIMCPTDFITDENVFDSDAIFDKNEHLPAKENCAELEDIKKHTQPRQSGESLLNDTPSNFEDMEDHIEQQNIDKDVEESRKGIISTKDHIEQQNIDKDVEESRKGIISTKDHIEQQNIDKDVEESRKGIMSTKVNTRPMPTKMPKPQKHLQSTLKSKILQSNIHYKEESIKLLKKEHRLKMKYHFRELQHQKVKHELELQNLRLQNKKAELEIQLLKNNM